MSTEPACIDTNNIASANSMGLKLANIFSLSETINEQKAQDVKPGELKKESLREESKDSESAPTNEEIALAYITAEKLQAKLFPVEVPSIHDYAGIISAHYLMGYTYKHPHWYCAGNIQDEYAINHIIIKFAEEYANLSRALQVSGYQSTNTHKLQKQLNKCYRDLRTVRVKDNIIKELKRLHYSDAKTDTNSSSLKSNNTNTEDQSMQAEKECKENAEPKPASLPMPPFIRAATTGSVNTKNTNEVKLANMLVSKSSPEWLVARSKVMNCNIHGRIDVSNLACTILDNRYFQKLDNQAQLAFCKKVYPTATHTRKAHSLGTYKLTKDMIRNIRTNSDSRELEHCMNAVAKRFGIENTLTDQICELVACAGLAHDLGHGPFSHQFDNVMTSHGLTDTEKYPAIEHEYRSGEILEMILKDIIEPGYIALMRSLIMADGEGFLYQIVSNELNGIDCDKFDYLPRDSVGLGVPISFDNRRLMMDVTAVEGDVCYPFQEREQLCEMYKSRAKLFNNAYAHKSTIALNAMMTDAMQELPIEELLDSIKNNDMVTFCKYTDTRIITMMEDDTGEAGRIWQRMVEYQLYHSVGEIRVKVAKGVNKSEQDRLETEVKMQVSALTDLWNGIYPGRESEFTIAMCRVGYLSGKRGNPLDILPLYSTGKDGVRRRRRVTRDEITTLMPDHHQEYQIIMIWKGIGDKAPYVERFNTLKAALKWT